VVLDRAKTDTVVGKTRVIDLLTSLPGYGPPKVTALLAQTGIVSSPSRRRPVRPPPPGAVRRTDIAGQRQALQARCSLHHASQQCGRSGRDVAVAHVVRCSAGGRS
jgi:hypothetical protein